PRFQQIDAAPAPGLGDQDVEPPALCRFLFGTDHPPRRDALIRRRLRREEAPRIAAGLELLRERGRQLRILSLLEAVDCGLRFAPLLDRRGPRRSHALAPGELGDAADVHSAPDAAGTPRREPDLVAAGVDALAYAIDPSEAERLVNRLGPRQGWLAGRAF